MHATQTIDTPPVIVRILAMPVSAEEGALGCSEVFALLDEFTEMQAAGRDTVAYHPLILPASAGLPRLSRGIRGVA